MPRERIPPVLRALMAQGAALLLLARIAEDEAHACAGSQQRIR